MEGIWYRLAQLLSEGDGVKCPDVRLGQLQKHHSYIFHSSRGALLAKMPDSSATTLRFLERSGTLPQASRFQDRASLLQRLISWLRSDEEKKLNEYGILTRRQAAEQSFWGRLGYHCFREYGQDCTFHPAVEENSGDFMLKCSSGDDRQLFEIVLPRPQVRKILALLAQLRSGAKQLPYIHIFALLNLLKRICDHPALALNKVQDYQKFESGKWELFQGLLFESLDNGQKVVVFSQYLGMVSMMERLLSNLDVGFATLAGASTNRGEIVRRFNEDANRKNVQTVIQVAAEPGFVHHLPQIATNRSSRDSLETSAFLIS